MEITDEIDELENIISTLNSLINDTNLEYYKTSLIELKNEAEKDLKSKNDFLSNEAEKEIEERNSEYWRDQF